MQDDPSGTEGGVSRRDAVRLATATVLLGRALGAPQELLAEEAGARSMLQLKFYTVDKSSPKLLHAGELPDELSRMILERADMVQLKLTRGDPDRYEELGGILMSDLLQLKRG